MSIEAVGLRSRHSKPLEREGKDRKRFLIIKHLPTYFFRNIRLVFWHDDLAEIKGFNLRYYSQKKQLHQA